MNPRRLRTLLLFCAACLPALLACRPTDRDFTGNTWSIVAADPATGEVGVAAASCVGEVPIDAIGMLVPGKGAAVAQAEINIDNRNAVFQLLQADTAAAEIVAAVARSEFDAVFQNRQYGVVTLDGKTAEAAAFTGQNNFAWAGDRQNLAHAVTVQGNLLEGETVVDAALQAFVAEEGPFPDRFMAALEAGSQAGGDARCNQEAAGIRQTASSALLMVARGDEPPFAVPAFGETAVGQPGTPWLYLSVAEPRFGANPVVELRRQYDAWRAANPATTAAAQEDEAVTLDWGTIAVLAALAVPCVTTLLIIVVGLYYRRRKRRFPPEE